jgi:hypothetical protein
MEPVTSLPYSQVPATCPYCRTHTVNNIFHEINDLDTTSLNNVSPNVMIHKEFNIRTSVIASRTGRCT